METKPAAKRPRRYLRSRITRKLILDTALEIFLKEGYAKTTITKISEQANVGYGTVYSHFKGKDDILNNIVDGVLEEFSTLLDMDFKPSSYEEAYDIFHRAIETCFRLTEQHRPIMKVFQESLGQSADITSHWEALKQRFIASAGRSILYSQLNGIAKNFDHVIGSKAYVLMIERFIWEVVQEKETDIKHLSKVLTDLIMQGFFIAPQ